MNDPTNKRKLDHVLLAAACETKGPGPFESLRLVPRALPEIDLEDVDPSIHFMGKRLAFPLLLTAMTGGDHELLRKINRNLAEAAETSGVALGLGSQRVQFTHPAARGSFEVRAWAPNTLVLANLGAVQFNYGFGLAQARDALAAAGADALCLHLNPLQEALQPEGNTRFSGLAKRIGETARALEKPVMVKEVGHGLSPVDVALLLEEGVRYFDVAGAGGTSWPEIEGRRTEDGGGGSDLFSFRGWGISAPEALRRLAPLRPRATFVASGGLRSGVDMLKAMALGASLCGAAAPFLNAAMESAEHVRAIIERWKREFTIGLFCLGFRGVEPLTGNKALVLEEAPAAAPDPGGQGAEG